MPSPPRGAGMLRVVAWARRYRPPHASHFAQLASGVLPLPSQKKQVSPSRWPMPAHRLHAAISFRHIWPEPWHVGQAPGVNARLGTVDIVFSIVSPREATVAHDFGAGRIAATKSAPGRSVIVVIYSESDGPVGIGRGAAPHRAPQDSVQHVLWGTVHFAKVERRRHDRVFP